MKIKPFINLFPFDSKGEFKYLYFLILLTLTCCSHTHGQMNLDAEKLKTSLIEVLKVQVKDSAVIADDFILDLGIDYYTAINSASLADELVSVTRLLPKTLSAEGLDSISFIKCHNWTAAYEVWFVIIENGAHSGEVYKISLNERRVESVISKSHYNAFWSLAEELYRKKESCAKNEDYMIIGQLVESRFVDYYSTQKYHRNDIKLFNLLFKTLTSLAQ